MTARAAPGRALPRPRFSARRQRRRRGRGPSWTRTRRAAPRSRPGGRCPASWRRSSAPGSPARARDRRPPPPGCARMAAASRCSAAVSTAAEAGIRSATSWRAQPLDDDRPRRRGRRWRSSAGSAARAGPRGCAGRTCRSASRWRWCPRPPCCRTGSAQPAEQGVRALGRLAAGVAEQRGHCAPCFLSDDRLPLAGTDDPGQQALARAGRVVQLGPVVRVLPLRAARPGRRYAGCAGCWSRPAASRASGQRAERGLRRAQAAAVHSRLTPLTVPPPSSASAAHLIASASAWRILTLPGSYPNGRFRRDRLPALAPSSAASC